MNLPVYLFPSYSMQSLQPRRLCEVLPEEQLQVFRRILSRKYKTLQGFPMSGISSALTFIRRLSDKHRNLLRLH